MISRYKKQIIRLSGQLQKLVENPNDLGLLFDLQVQILKQIQRTERRISNYRAGLRALKHRLGSEHLPKHEAKNVKVGVSAMHHAIGDYHRLLFFWRAIGDGIAFVYLDKWAMKHVLYNTDNIEVKQSAGFVGGKAGLKRELAVLKKITAAGVPCLLTDFV